MFEGFLQPMHLVIIPGVLLLFFGPQKLPRLGKGIGDTLYGFKKTLQEETEGKPRPPNNPKQPLPHG